MFIYAHKLCFFMKRKYSGSQGLHINSQLLPNDCLAVTRQDIEPKTYRFTPLTVTPSGTIHNFCVESSYIKSLGMYFPDDSFDG